MLVSAAVTQSYRTVLSTLQADLGASVREAAAGVDARELPHAMPVVVEPYLEVGSMTGATFFEEQRVAQVGAGTYYAQTINVPEKDRVAAITAWALSGAGMPGAPTAVVLSAALVGGMSRLLTERVNDTVIGNAEADTKTTWTYQRVPRANCCAFCGMLASRGAVYHSEASAGAVVGRGVAIPATKRRGGQAKGIRPRGSRRMGEKYHDHCYCSIVPVKRGNGVVLPYDESSPWYDAYRRAREGVDAGAKLEWTETKASDGTVYRKHYWVDGDGKRMSTGFTDEILNAMRRDMYAAGKA